MNIKVIKRDGIVEEFDPVKISKVANTAGLSPEQSNYLAETIQKWLNEREQPMVSSFIIRMKILEELEKIDPHAAELYEWYGKTKDDTSKNSNES